MQMLSCKKKPRNEHRSGINLTTSLLISFLLSSSLVKPIVASESPSVVCQSVDDGDDGNGSCKQPIEEEEVPVSEGQGLVHSNTKRGTTTSPQNNRNSNRRKTSYKVPTNEEKNEAGDNNIKNACSVYLAPSTIPGSGLGMFSGKYFYENDLVTKGDIVIPLSELDWHLGFKDISFLWEEYTWSASSFPGLHEETDYNAMQGCSTGIGAAINCILPLINIVDGYSKLDDVGLHRAKDPGAGAFTYIHDRTSFATRNIVPGEELFIDYGEHYFESRTEVYGLLPLMDDFDHADEILDRYDTMMKRLKNDRKKELLLSSKKENNNFDQNRKFKLISDDLVNDVYDIIKNFPFESRTINAIPETNDNIDYILKEGTSMQHYNRSLKSLDWLSENGQCMDNIYPGKSTIRQAGRGVFASRFIPKDGLVSPAPLIHIKHKGELIMYDLLPENLDGVVSRNASAPNHYQLLLNYCFGHPDSTLLLSPYGMFTSLINHAPLASEKVNTRIIWSKNMRNPQWMNQTMKSGWVHDQHSGLSWDFVATRDIQPNEEIFIDYGVQWDVAWSHHVKKWQPAKDNHSETRPYIPAFKLENDVNLVIKTMNDDYSIGSFYYHYSENIKVYIREEYRLMRGLKPAANNEEFHRCRPISKYYPKRNDDKSTEALYLTEIVKFQTYNIQKICTIKVTEIMFNLPRDAFHFVDEAYTRDNQREQAFRHEMMIPDDMFPEAWKNRKHHSQNKYKNIREGENMI